MLAPTAAAAARAHLRRAQGFPRDKLALIGTLFVPLEITLPILLSRVTSGPRPLMLYAYAVPLRLALSLLHLPVLWALPDLRALGGHVPWSVYAMVLAVGVPYRACATAMFVSQMAFFAKVADPRVGGACARRATPPQPR